MIFTILDYGVCLDYFVQKSSCKLINKYEVLIDPYMKISYLLQSFGSYKFVKVLLGKARLR